MGTEGRVAFKVLSPLKKVIVSVAQMMNSGFDVRLGDAPYMHRWETNVYTKIYERNGVFVVPIRIKGTKALESFPRQAGHAWRP